MSEGLSFNDLNENDKLMLLFVYCAVCSIVTVLIAWPHMHARQFGTYVET